MSAQKNLYKQKSFWVVSNGGQTTTIATPIGGLPLCLDKGVVGHPIEFKDNNLCLRVEFKLCRNMGQISKL